MALCRYAWGCACSRAGQNGERDNKCWPQGCVCEPVECRVVVQEWRTGPFQPTFVA